MVGWLWADASPETMDTLVAGEPLLLLHCSKYEFHYTTSQT